MHKLWLLDDFFTNFLFSNISIIEHYYFYHQKQRFRAHTHIHTFAIHSQIWHCLIRWGWSDSFLGVDAQTTGISKEQETQIIMSELKICAWQIPDVLEIQTTFRNPDGVLEGNRQMVCQPTEHCLALIHWVLKEISTKSMFTQSTLFFVLSFIWKGRIQSLSPWQTWTFLQSL